MTDNKSKEQFVKNQSQSKAGTGNKAKRKAKVEYLLDTKLFCGQCHSPMVGDSIVSEDGSMCYCYKCTKHKDETGTCTKRNEDKEELERYVANIAAKYFEQPGVIDTVAQKTYDFYQAEFENSELVCSLKQELTETESRLNDLLSALEPGVRSPFLESNIKELEGRKKALSGQIEIEKRPKPYISKEHIANMLHLFCKGNIEDIDCRRHIINTLVRSVCIFDAIDNKSRTITVALNATENESLVEISVSID